MNRIAPYQRSGLLERLVTSFEVVPEQPGHPHDAGPQPTGGNSNQ